MDRQKKIKAEHYSLYDFKQNSGFPVKHCLTRKSHKKNFKRMLTGVLKMLHILEERIFYNIASLCSLIREYV